MIAMKNLVRLNELPKAYNKVEKIKINNIEYKEVLLKEYNKLPENERSFFKSFYEDKLYFFKRLKNEKRNNTTISNT